MEWAIVGGQCGGFLGFFFLLRAEMQKWPPVWLCALGLDRQDASLCMRHSVKLLHGGSRWVALGCAELVVTLVLGACMSSCVLCGSSIVVEVLVLLGLVMVIGAGLGELTFMQVWLRWPFVVANDSFWKVFVH